MANLKKSANLFFLIFFYLAFIYFFFSFFSAPFCVHAQPEALPNVVMKKFYSGSFKGKCGDTAFTYNEKDRVEYDNDEDKLNELKPIIETINKERKNIIEFTDDQLLQFDVFTTYVEDGEIKYKASKYMLQNAAKQICFEALESLKDGEVKVRYDMREKVGMKKRVAMLLPTMWSNVKETFYDEGKLQRRGGLMIFISILLMYYLMQNVDPAIVLSAVGVSMLAWAYSAFMEDETKNMGTISIKEEEEEGNATSSQQTISGGEDGIKENTSSTGGDSTNKGTSIGGGDDSKKNAPSSEMLSDEEGGITFTANAPEGVVESSL